MAAETRQIGGDTYTLLSGYWRGPEGQSVHEDAEVHSSCRLGENSIVHEKVELDHAVVLGVGVVVGPGTRVRSRTHLGDRCHLERDCFVGSGSELGHHVYAGREAHIGYDCEVGDYTMLPHREVVVDQAIVGKRGAGYASGLAMGYAWYAYRTKDGTIRLEFGCVNREAEHWPHRDMAEMYHLKTADQYEQMTRALAKLAVTVCASDA